MDKYITQIEIVQTPDSVPKVKMDYSDKRQTKYKVQTENRIPIPEFIGAYNSIGLMLAERSGFEKTNLKDMILIKLKFKNDKNWGLGISGKFDIRVPGTKTIAMTVDSSYFWDSSSNKESEMGERMYNTLQVLLDKADDFANGKEAQMTLPLETEDQEQSEEE